LQFKIIPPHRHPTTTHQKRKEGWRNDPKNQDILPYPPRGAYGELKWKGCPLPPVTFQIVIILTAGFKSHLNDITK